MKKLTLLALMLLCSGGALALSAKDLPKKPPPYGAYYLAHNKDTNVELRARKVVIAKHYGFSDFMEAHADCMKVSGKLDGKFDCNKDSFAHKRDSHPIAQIELKKYGFKDWREAVKSCEAKPRTDLDHCTYDPFLRIRGK